jgi:hypothetical protein
MPQFDSGAAEQIGRFSERASPKLKKKIENFENYGTCKNTQNFKNSNIFS